MIDPRAPDFSNTPVSPRRPTPWFRAQAGAPPAVSIVTAFHHARAAIFAETARSVLGQSLQQWEWIVVDDASPDAEARVLLAELAARDPRIRVLRHQRSQGPSAARNAGFRAARSEFLYPLDDDDLLEPTALEKTLWFLTSNPECAFANGWSVAFGAREYVWTQGFHQGAAFLEDNLVTGRALVRKSTFEATGGYDEGLREGLEDWDFWLRCASRGLWGATIPECLDWYRRRADHADRWRALGGEAHLEAFRERARALYPHLFAGGFPELRPRGPTPFEPVPDDLPCENRLEKNAPRLLLVVPWLTLGGADRFNLDLAEQLTRRGWQVSVATTLQGDHSWASEFTRHTPDVHILSHFLRLADHPRYLRYLIGSRRPDVVLISNSELAYLLLPYLRGHCPEPAYADYCHMEEEEWKNGGYPRHSVAMQHCLDLNLVASEHLRRWMIARGARPDPIQVVHINVDAGDWRRRPEARQRLREAWGAGELPVILYAARLCAQKQPRVLARTLLELRRRGLAFRAVVAGDGEDRAELEAFLREHGLEKSVLSLGPVPLEQMRDLMSASDIFFLPSRWEGIALSLYEAMALELAVVAADVGGQRELVTPDCGLLLPRGEEEVEVRRYADALEALLVDPGRVRDLGRRARERVESEFRLDAMVDRLLALFARARESPRSPEPPMAPELAREWAARAVEYVRMADLADLLWADAERHRRGETAAAAGPGDPLGALGAEQELWRIEASRSWRAVQRLRRHRALRALLDGGAPGEAAGASGDPRERLARIRASRPYRLIRALKRSRAYRLYARRRFGPGWESGAPLL